MTRTPDRRLQLGLRRAWQALPSLWRRRFGHLLLEVAAPRATGEAPALARGATVRVAGLLSNASGIGEGARLCAEALESLGWPVIRSDLTSVFAAVNVDEARAGDTPASPGPGGAVIIHLNPPLLPHARLLLRGATVGQRVIGYWAWELPAIPHEWRRAFDYVHEVWAPSAFCAEAIRPYTNRPVRVVPHPVMQPRPALLGRTDFGLPDKAFVALTMLHFGSGFERKNPLAAIRAFRTAFGNRADTVLVVKVTADTNLPWAERALADAVADAPNIRVLERTLPRSHLAALVAASDAVISLHRSEGFGLVLAEAMRCGRAVVATGWSGNMEFMSADSAALVGYTLVPVADPQGTYGADQVWAEPDEMEAAGWLVRLAEDAGLRACLGGAAERRSEATLGRAAFERAVEGALPLRADASI